MTSKITFYAILGPGATIDRPAGLLRRLEYDVGWEDEGLQRDMSWRPPGKRYERVRSRRRGS